MAGFIDRVLGAGVAVVGAAVAGVGATVAGVRQLSVRPRAGVNSASILVVFWCRQLLCFLMITHDKGYLSWVIISGKKHNKPIQALIVCYQIISIKKQLSGKNPFPVQS